MYSICIFKSTEIWEAILSDEYRGIVVLLCDIVEFLADPPWYHLEHG
jgi:hypothetical protein